MDLLISLTAGKPGGQGKRKGGLETDDHLGIIPAPNTYTDTHTQTHTHTHTHIFLTTLDPHGETKNFTYRIVFPKSYGKPPKSHCLPSPNLPRVAGGLGGQGYKLLKINASISISGPLSREPCPSGILRTVFNWRKLGDLWAMPSWTLGLCFCSSLGLQNSLQCH